MKNATMLYKAPGPYEIHGGRFDYAIVDADEEGAIDAAKADGWRLTTPEAKADLIVKQEAADLIAKQEAKDLVPPTRAELEQKANELGIKFSDKTSNKRLICLIEEITEA